MLDPRDYIWALLAGVVFVGGLILLGRWIAG
jgi:hypothetical protein